MMEYKIYYNGQETSDFGTLASWFMEVYNKMRGLEEANEQHRDDMNQVRILNKSLENEITELKVEKRKTNEVLKRYCGDSVDAPIPTIVGWIIDDYFYQKAETENQVRELQKAEKTIEGLNKELVEYADKVEALEKDASFIPTLPTLAEKINDITCRYSMPVTPIDHRKARTEHIFQCVQELAEYAKKQRDHIYSQDAIIANQTEQINKIEEKAKVQGDREIEHAAEITGLKREISTLKRELEELRTKNNKYSRVAKDALDAGFGAAGTIRELEEENASLKTELEERKNKRSPRWPSDVMRICVLESKVDELTKENERLRYSQPWMHGMSSKEATNRIFGINGTIHKLREENAKLKDALEFCQKEASSAREHARNIEFNAERIRLGID